MILFYYISFFLCYYYSINLKRQSEHSGLRLDTSSLILFCRELEINLAKQAKDEKEELSTTGAVISGISFVTFSFLIVTCTFLRGLLSSDVSQRLIPSTETRDHYNDILISSVLILITLNMIVTFVIFILLNKTFRDTLKSIFLRNPGQVAPNPPAARVARNNLLQQVNQNHARNFYNSGKCF